MHRLSAALLIALALGGPARAQTQDRPPLPELLQRAGAANSRGTPDLTGLDASPTRDQQLPLFRAVMAAPLDAPYRAGVLGDSFRSAAGSPHELIGLAGALSGARLRRPVDSGMAAIEARLRAAPDPLAAGLAWMASTKVGAGWVPVLPDHAQLPNPLRYELARVLAALSQSHQFLQRAFERFPPGVTPQLLRRQALEGRLSLFETPDYRQLLPLVEREAVLAGMLDLVGAVERLQAFVKNEAALPSVAWSLQTPFGWIVVDTTGRHNRHQLKDALLVLDVGGDDDYEFLAQGDTHTISVLLDHRGNDRYRAAAPGADPSSATLGYGLLWDTEGDDRYQGTQQAQASALFGAALLVDGGGSNRFVASSHSQAHGIGGLAVLVSAGGNDEFSAQTYSQATGGPRGVAVLVDTGGNDRYTLGNVPLVRPSPQLPDRNTSMGQGAGYGMRGDFFDGRSTAGGIGMLLDLAGNDRYDAQVFAQGVGYHEGLGMLLDDGGNDRFESAWYAMGAGVHYAAGIFLERGAGRDVYRSTHEIALGSANDLSVGVFVDEGGDDEYTVGQLSLGVAHANSTGLFVDGAGNDRYTIMSATCRALGAAYLHEWGNPRESLPNLGLFLDLGGVDSYPTHCVRAANNQLWAGPRAWPLLDLRSEAAAGVDGEWPLPFALRLLTRPAAPAAPQ
ncbi:hypothetical protein EZ313_16245 [Ramlibacter henchirensis]|uniref:Uncharacterized protein n=1 Tax=Ramlibacter henchirensis TaxID=204072 RepID=A0A4Z0BVQ8_9BURK|nr:hypothetical protein [Ramlibacter henchirensis]TFZ02792.1 hypothetical protein EZ313_16245 [Ramlibacter henchirensis]